MIRSCLCSLIVGIPALLGGRELLPWFGPDLDFQGRLTAMVVDFDEIDTDNGWLATNQTSHYYVAGLSLAVDDFIEVEVEVGAAHRAFRSSVLDFDFAQVTGRYLAANDVAGDPLSVVLGLTITGAGKTGIRDLAAMRNGHLEFEAHASAGKEWACGPCWVWRAWSVLGFGMANQGGPWIRNEYGLERNFFDRGNIRLFAKGLLGLGDHPLKLGPPFGGYASVRNRSVDVGVRVTAYTDEFGEWSFEYAHRLAAKNTILEADFLQISYLVSLGFL